MQTFRPRDSAEVQLHIVGAMEEVYDDPVTVLKVNELANSPTSLRLLDAVFAIEQGCTVCLWWEDERGESLLLPLEGRGRLELGPVGGISNPKNEGWTGHVQLTTHHTLPGPKSFFIGLEFAKQK